MRVGARGTCDPSAWRLTHGSRHGANPDRRNSHSAHLFKFNRKLKSSGADLFNPHGWPNPEDQVTLSLITSIRGSDSEPASREWLLFHGDGL